MNFYVYSILDPRKPGNYKYDNIDFSYEPIYIGKGRRNRLYEHLHSNSLKKNSFKNNKIKNILKENFKPIIIKLKENLTEQDAFSLEKEYISKIKRYPEGPLTNLTDGGEGPTGLKHTPEAKEKMSNTWFGNADPWNKGKKMSEEYRKTLSDAHLGQIIPESTRLAVSKAHKGKKQTVEWIEKKVNSMCKKTYKLVSPEGKEYIIKNYNKFCKEHNLSTGSISNVLSKKYKQYNGWTGCVV